MWLRSCQWLALSALLAASGVPGARAAAPDAVRAPSVAEAMSQAEAALDARNPAAATNWLQPLLVRSDLPAARQAELHWLSARARFMADDGEAALQAAASALAAARQSGDGALLAELLQDRALLALLTGAFEVAVDDLATLEKLATEAEEPQLAFDARVAATRLLAERGNADRALERLSALVAEARGVDLRAAYQAVGEVWLAKRDGERAESAFSTVLRVDPDSAEAYVGRSAARLMQQRDAGARADLAAAREAAKRQPSSLQRDRVVAGFGALEADLRTSAAAEDPATDDGLGEVRAAIESGNWEDARAAAESAIMRDRNAPAPRAALAEVYLRQGEFGGAANVFSSMTGLAGESRYPRAGGTLAQGLMGVEVYDVEGFAEDWATLKPAEQATLRAAVAAARARGPLAPTAARLVAVVEAAP